MHTATFPEPPVAPSELDGHRRLLMNIAYRMLGSVADAEDVVQETFLRWYAQSDDQRIQIESVPAWLVRVCSRICLDLLGSARVRRENYVGEWLPEPLPERGWSSHVGQANVSDPADLVTQDESVHLAVLVVLEKMAPAQRVAFVLHDVFRYPFADIADVLARSPEACRQLATSARRRIPLETTPSPQPSIHGQLVRDFMGAWARRDVKALIALLDPTAVGMIDGGGVVSAAVEPLWGAEQIARFFVEIADRQPNLNLEIVTVNGQPGLRAFAGSHTLAVIALQIERTSVASLFAIRNPEKLGRWQFDSGDEQ